jgi:hypothetical protein
VLLNGADASSTFAQCDTLHYSTRSFDKASDAIKKIVETR